MPRLSEVTVLQAVREQALIWTAAAIVAHLGTHSAPAESERFGGRSLDARGA
jgi:hypothetical protein